MRTAGSGNSVHCERGIGICTNAKSHTKPPQKLSTPIQDDSCLRLRKCNLVLSAADSVLQDPHGRNFRISRKTGNTRLHGK